MKHRVYTRDVDGGTSRSYRKVESAVKRFEAMYGHPIANAIADHFFRFDEPPTLEKLAANNGFVRAVSDYGCVVEIEFGTEKEAA